MVLRLPLLFMAFFAIAFSLLPGIRSVAEEEPAAAGTESQATLQIGDQAPELVVDYWLKGEEVESFVKDNVYVVEFWATWCAPCVKSMPHLSELAERYSKDGLVVVAMTNADEANTREAVDKFIDGPGKDFSFRYAMCESDAASRAYMEASGQKGIPCSFVIDRDGKLAYIGNPHDLDYVLERVMAGKWRGKVDADELREMNESIAKLGEISQSDPDKAMQILDHIRRVNPSRTKGLDFAYVEMMVLCKKGMFDKAKELVESHCQGSGNVVDWGAVAMISGALSSKELNPEGQHYDFAMAKIQLAEVSLKDDWQNLVQVAMAYNFGGNMDKYKECMETIIKLCPDENVKKSLQMAMEMQQQLRSK